MTAQKKPLALRRRKDNTPEENLRRLAALRRKADEVKKQIDERQTELVGQLKDEGKEKVTFYDEDADVTITGTLVQGSSVILDEDKLKKRVGAAIWRKVTRPQIDKSLLDSAISAGDVDTVDVAASSTTVDKKPFIKVTTK